MSGLGRLVDRIKQGKVVLFFGSGALVGAKLPTNKIPLGNDLRDILCSRFLNDNFRDADLAHVAAMAISNASMFDVQDFIKDYLSGIKPADFHYIIPKFKWRALLTTNYDLLIEGCYQNEPKAVQKLSVILSNEDNFDETRTTNDRLPYLKLHGCVTRAHDSNLPLILTTDQYNESLASRRRLFSYLYELAYENTLVFVGHSLLDHNIRSVMLKLEKEAPHGQRHYLLKPGVDRIESDFWAQKKITALDISFEDFLTQISELIPDNERVLSLIRPSTTHPIQSVFSSHVQPSDELIDFLANHVEWITPQHSASPTSPKDFFKGINQGWSPVFEGIAITRKLENDIFEFALSLPDVGRKETTAFFVIKGEAGSGKSVLLRQLAWRTCNSGLGVVLWVRGGGVPDYYLVEEIISKSTERVFLFWDDSAINSTELNRFLLKANENNLKVTVISAERYNEWNVRCEALDELITDKFELRYLSEIEIEELVAKLEKFDSLGPNLIHKKHQDRCIELKEIHGRQLLVALHEATMGEPFEDIIFNEYENIYPESAKSIYLTVCTLNRLKVPVRAGLMSRIHEISFSDFSSRFHKPLEKVVIAKGHLDQDMHYYARHSEIAEIVFRRALSNTADRYQEYIRIINKLNISFSSDKSSFRSLIRAKSLHELFPDHEDVSAIYSHARAIVGDDPYLLQQIANYERIRPNGSLDKAKALLLEASVAAPYDQSILHSLSVVWRDKTHETDDIEYKKHFRAEARGYLDKIASRWGMNSYISVTIVELALDSLEDILKDGNSTPVTVREAIRKAQHEITENKRQFPGDSHLSSLEEKFARLVDDDDKAFEALKRAFEESDREPYLAIRLANSYVNRGETEEAKSTLQQALDRKRADHRLNYHYAELLRNDPPVDVEQLIYFYRRGYTPGDGNYHAQFWLARYGFMSNKDDTHKNALDIFENLRKAKLAYSSRIEIRDYDSQGEDLTEYGGVIKVKRSGFGFVVIDGSGYEVFFPAQSVEDGLWEAMREGDRVKFNLGYSFKGPQACNLKC